MEGLGSHPAGFMRPEARAVADRETAVGPGCRKVLLEHQMGLVVSHREREPAEIIPN